MKQHISYVVIFILLCFSLYQCNRIIEINAMAEANTKAFTDSVSYYKNSLGSYTATISTLQLEKKAFNEALLNKDAKIKKLAKDFAAVKSVVSTKNNLTIDTIAVHLEKPITVNNSLRFERNGKIVTPWYSLGYKITNDSLTIAPFRAQTETTIITGSKRKWLLGKQTIVTEITNTNPYITTTNIQAAEVIIHEPWYRKWYVWLAAGIAGGIFLK